VVLNSGHTFHEKELATLNDLLFPRLGEWAIIKVPDDPSRPAPEVVVGGGFFDERWDLSVQEDDRLGFDPRFMPSSRPPGRAFPEPSGYER
jgi:hypothetical protein